MTNTPNSRGDHNLVCETGERITGLIHYKRIGGTEFQSVFEMFGPNLHLQSEQTLIWDLEAICCPLLTHPCPIHRKVTRRTTWTRNQGKEDG